MEWTTNSRVCNVAMKNSWLCDTNYLKFDKDTRETKRSRFEILKGSSITEMYSNFNCIDSLNTPP